MRTANAECSNNQVDAEALLRLTLKTLEQLVDQAGNRARLKELLEERARAEAGSVSDSRTVTLVALVRKIAELKEDVDTASKRMAKERDDNRYQAIACEFDRLKGDLQIAERELSKQSQSKKFVDLPEQEVNAAMALFDSICAVANDGAARLDVRRVVEQLNLWIGLQFVEAIKGKRRAVRKLAGGIMVFDENHLPVKLHGRDRIEDDQQQHDLNQSLAARADQEKSNPLCGPEGVRMQKADASIDPFAPSEPLTSRRKGISYTKVNRGDRRCTFPNDMGVSLLQHAVSGQFPFTAEDFTALSDD